MSGGLLGYELECWDVVGDGSVRAGCDDITGAELVKEFSTEREAVRHMHVRASAACVFMILDTRYATWLVDDGVPPNMVARVVGHEKITTTLQRYTRRTRR